MVINCCVPQCASTQITGSDVKFHKFPSNIQLVTRWLRALKSGKKPSKYAKVCSLHFKEEDYKPTIYEGYTKRFLKRNAIPSEQLPKTSHGPKAEKNVQSRQRRFERNIRLDSDLGSPHAQNASVTRDDHVQNANVLQDTNDVETIDIVTNRQILMPEIETEVSIHSPIMNLAYTRFRNKTTQTSQFAPIALYYNRLLDEQFKIFTGLPYNRFEILFSFLAQTLPSPFDKYLSKRDQLMFCLIKYRQNIIFSIIGNIYGLSLLTTRQIFVHWTHIMNAAFAAVNWWSLRFKKPHAYTVILDCSEIATQHSRLNPELNQCLFSHYKNKNTLKYLLGVNEKGVVIFCSQVFCGSVSDRSIVVESKITDKLSKGDILLADRGFDISDLLEAKGVAINIPPFLRNQQQLTPNEVIETRKIANRRILVERVIGLAKFNNILAQIIPSYLWPYADEIVFVGNLLNNLKKNIID